MIVARTSNGRHRVWCFSLLAISGCGLRRRKLDVGHGRRIGQRGHRRPGGNAGSTAERRHERSRRHDRRRGHDRRAPGPAATRAASARRGPRARRGGAGSGRQRRIDGQRGHGRKLGRARRHHGRRRAWRLDEHRGNDRDGRQRRRRAWRHHGRRRQHRHGRWPRAPRCRARDAAARRGTPTSGHFTIDASGTMREYIIKMPTGYDRNHPYRLIVAFHGRMYDAASVDAGGAPSPERSLLRHRAAFGG